MNAPDPFAVEALDALPSHVAVLDEAGTVVAVNKRWRRFGRANGATSDYVGSNYFDTCAPSAEEDRAAMRASKGLRRLIAGEIDSFGLVYVCALRVFRLRASRICEGPWRVLVSHEDITAIIAARQQRDRVSADLTEAQRRHASALGEACEELGQRLTAITLAAHVLQHAAPANTAVTTIQLAADEAKRELRLLKPQVNGAARPPTP